MPREFKLPDLGEGITEAQVIRVLVREGDRVEEDQYLMEVETDKAAVEIPSPYAGIAKKIHVSENQTINVGDVIVTFDDGAGDDRAVASPAKAKAEREGAEPVPAEAGAVAKAVPAGDRTTVPAAPAVRRLARETGIDLNTVAGTGPGGRVTREDLERHAAGRAAPAPATPASREPAAAAAPAAPSAVTLPPRPMAAPAELPEGIDDTDKWGEIRRVPLNQIRKTIANQLAKSASTIPHVTHMDEVEITELERVRRELNDATGNNPKLTLMAFLIRALCVVLKKFPIFNACFDEQEGQILYKKYVNMGIAVDAERGLIVPVIRNADLMSTAAIAHELRSIADRIRSNQFAIEDLRGGTFTISNFGALGGIFATPIINHPEVAILGLGRSRILPVIEGDEIREAIMLPLSLSFDHRATDGANAARFVVEVMRHLNNPSLLLLH
jgi:pyruvate dehydrogenase E2 component (dihydrolipoamide acetyltransferase)